MGNIGTHSGHITSHREDRLCAKLSFNRNLNQKFWERSGTGMHQIKVLPDLQSKHGLRHTNNGEILHSGGTLSGRHPTRFRNAPSRPSTPNRQNPLQRAELKCYPYHDGQKVFSQKLVDSQLKLHRSEPDLRCPSLVGHEMRKKKIKRKYKAPPPPTNTGMQRKQLDTWDQNVCNEHLSRRARLFKTKFESKKESNQISRYEKAVENNNSDDIVEVVEEQIQARENLNYLLPKLLPGELNYNDSNKFKKELREATDRLKAAKADTIDLVELYEPSENLVHPDVALNRGPVIAKRCLRGEPSGKESSTSEASPIPRSTDIRKPTEFFFGIKRQHLDAASCNYHLIEDEENSTIALRLRPVLPRKPTQIPRFSPAAAWKLLDARSQDSGISGDSRPPLSSSWTPQQDLGDDSSIDDAIGEEEPKSVIKHRSNVFSLSLPRDHQPVPFLATTFNKTGQVSSLGRLKKSVSGVLNTLSIKRGEFEKGASAKENNNSNWFFTRSAPNSLNDNSLDIPEVYLPRSNCSSTARVIYLPNTKIRVSPADDKHSSTVLSKSCEELRVPESLRDSTTVLDIPWFPKEGRQQKNKKFTFQSTIRQIEKKRMADKLSKEAERKERQRLRELEAMQRVEEEFQRKRAKEKASIRQQLRRYTMDDNRWTSLPYDINDETEERQEPDGALSSSESSSAPSPNCSENLLKQKLEARLTRELSEYRQMQRNYKEYRGSAVKYFSQENSSRQSTVNPEVNCNMS